ncbi:MAG: hypothetical protein AAGK02_09320, partial [Pseudomonadota bacterium]
IYLVALFIISTGDVANNLGFWLASGQTQDAPSSLWLVATNALTAAIVLSLAFYSGFVFAWLRDKIGERE